MNTPKQLFKSLNESQVQYCHWKSNLILTKSLAGDTDIDLLVRRQDAVEFQTILKQMGFRQGYMDGLGFFPAMEHYFALDCESGKLVHVHVYYRVITGESLAKNYHLPLEDMLLNHVRYEGDVRVPSKGAELVVFVLRMMSKHTALVELALLYREKDELEEEIHWLLEDGSLDESLALLKTWMPSVNPELFTACVNALKDPAAFFKRILLAHQLKPQLKSYRRHNQVKAWWIGIQKFMVMLFRRITRTKKGMKLFSGGAVIAFVGPEATGKSTLLGETRKWLSEHFTVEQFHVGKPKSTVLSFIPNLVVPILRFVLPSYRSSRVEINYTAGTSVKEDGAAFPLMFGIRSVLLAHDRKMLITHAYRRASNGEIILCDRFPSYTIGAADSPQLEKYSLRSEENSFRHHLVKAEKRLYNEIPPPDLVISLTVPVEVAIARNKNRGKEEPEDYVIYRHSQHVDLDYGRAKVVNINTDQSLDQTILDVKKAIWNAL